MHLVLCYQNLGSFVCIGTCILSYRTSHLVLYYQTGARILYWDSHPVLQPGLATSFILSDWDSHPVSGLASSFIFSDRGSHPVSGVASVSGIAACLITCPRIRFYLIRPYLIQQKMRDPLIRQVESPDIGCKPRV